MKPQNYTELPWHALYVHFKAEKKICEKLEEQKVETYLPLYTKINYYRNRKRKSKLPLISCYVFARIPHHLRNHVLNIPGVVKYVKSDNRPATIPPREINTLKRLTESSYNYNIEVENYFGIGEDVCIVHGPLNGLKGEIIEKRGQKRFIIKINSINQAISVEIENDCLQSVH